MNDGRAEWPRFVNAVTVRADVLIARRPIGFRDALMVSGFDLLGHNRTLQVHWLKRVVAFFLDLITVFAPLWSFLYLEGVRAAWVYGVAGGMSLFAYSTFSEAISRTTVGKFIVGLEVRSLRGPMSLSKAAAAVFTPPKARSKCLVHAFLGLVGTPGAVVSVEAVDAAAAAGFMVQFSRVTDATTSLALPIEEFKWTW